MNTPTLTFAQLREDLEALASVHPSTPTNVIRVFLECGEVVAEYSTDEEDQLREELANAEDAVTKTAAQVTEYEEKADAAEAENQRLRAEMDALADPTAEGETVLTYRQRADSMEEARDTAYTQVREMRRAYDEMERELKALRKRKGVTAGVFKHIHALLALLQTVANHTVSITKLDSERAKALLKDIQTT